MDTASSCDWAREECLESGDLLSGMQHLLKTCLPLEQTLLIFQQAKGAAGQMKTPGLKYQFLPVSGVEFRSGF